MARSSPVDPVKPTSFHFRLGERHFQQHEFQSAANEFLGALKGESHPKWIDAWAHFDLGEIFDVTSQRADPADQARLISAMGRQEFVQLSFDIDTAGHPVHILAQKASAQWGKDTFSFVSAWRFFPQLTRMTAR